MSTGLIDRVRDHIPEEEEIRQTFDRVGEEYQQVVALTDHRLVNVEVNQRDRKTETIETILLDDVTGTTIKRVGPEQPDGLQMLEGGLALVMGLLVLFISSDFEDAVGLSLLIVGIVAAAAGGAWALYALDTEPGHVDLYVHSPGGSQNSLRFPEDAEGFAADISRAVGRIVV